MTSRSRTATADIWATVDDSAALDRYRELAKMIDAGILENTDDSPGSSLPWQSSGAESQNE